jgi:hypothetical protein
MWTAAEREAALGPEHHGVFAHEVGDLLQLGVAELGGGRLGPRLG